MKTIAVVIFVVVMSYILVNRERLYLRDPLASVYRNEIEQPGFQIYINYSNDVLLIHEAKPESRVLIQDWNKTPGWPVILKCVRYMACVVDSSHAMLFPSGVSGSHVYVPNVVMSKREVTYVDTNGSKIRVDLR